MYCVLASSVCCGQALQLWFRTRYRTTECSSAVVTGMSKCLLSGCQAVSRLDQRQSASFNAEMSDGRRTSLFVSVLLLQLQHGTEVGAFPSLQIGSG